MVIAVGALCVGCASPAHTPSLPALDANVQVGLDASVAPALDAAVAPDASFWLASEVALEADGRSAPITFALGGLPRPVVALRAHAGGGLCFQLEDVRADGVQWVPTATSADYGDYCTRCPQRVAMGSGYGMFVLPSAVAPDLLATIELRVALRDCLTASPLALDAPRPSKLLVESASFSAPLRDHRLALPILIAVATPEAFTGGASLDQVFARMREIWRMAGIELSLQTVSVPRPIAPLLYGATDREALASLAHTVEESARSEGFSATPWLALTPCLVREQLGQRNQPLAFTTHVPGGFAVGDEPDGMFVAAERCGGLTPSARYVDSETLAVVMAHELGHYLGLFHVQEADGREDTLADTQSGQANLMQAMPRPNEAFLSDTQVSIARRHPVFATGAVGD